MSDRKGFVGLTVLKAYWWEITLTAVVIVVSMIAVPRVMPSTSHIGATKSISGEIRYLDTWPISLHVKGLPD